MTVPRQVETWGGLTVVARVGFVGIDADAVEIGQEATHHLARLARARLEGVGRRRGHGAVVGDRRGHGHGGEGGQEDGGELHADDDGR